jgi:ribosomal protein L21E
MNIKNTPKALLDAVSKVLQKATFHVEEEITILENKTVKEVDEPKAKGEKDFKLLHLRDLVLHVAEASSDEVLYEDNMELVKKAAGGSAQKIKVKGGKMTMDSFTASTLMAIMKAVKPSVKKGIEDVINSGDKTKILKLVDLAFKSTGRKEDVNELDEAKISVGDLVTLQPNKNTLDRNLIGKAGVVTSMLDGDAMVKFANGRTIIVSPRHLKINESAKGDKEEYQKFFQGMLKKFGVKSPAELSGDKEKEFYDAIDAGWKADDEKKESIEEEISLDEAKELMKVKTHTPAAAQRLFKKLRNKFSDFRQPNSDDMVKGDVVHYPNEPQIKRYIKQQPEVKELDVKEASSKSSTGYDLYHDTFSGAMQHAYDFAKKKLGVTVDPNEIDKNVALGPKKPSSGKTNSYRLKGKGGAIQVQVYNMDNKKYELNMYKEEVVTNYESIKEAVRSMDKDAKLKIFNDLKKGDNVQIKYDSSIRKGEDYQNFTVTRNKSVVGKARVEKIILAKDGKPGGVKFFLYNRNGMVSFAIGDMGAVIVDMKKG